MLETVASGSSVVKMVEKDLMTVKVARLSSKRGEQHLSRWITIAQTAQRAQVWRLSVATPMPLEKSAGNFHVILPLFLAPGPLYPR
jgi:hypothetical protein